MPDNKLFSISALSLLAVMWLQSATAKELELAISNPRKLAVAAPSDAATRGHDRLPLPDAPGQDRLPLPDAPGQDRLPLPDAPEQDRLPLPDAPGQDRLPLPDAPGQDRLPLPDAPGQDRLPVWDCSDLPYGYPSGVYSVLEGGCSSLVMAYCDLSDGAGWTVFQRRQEAAAQLSFARRYDDYRYGFGPLDAEFWWGLEDLWRITQRPDRVYELRIDLTDFSGDSRYALYGEFSVSSHDDGFKLKVSNFSGDAGDGFSYHSGMTFSAIGKDRDGCSCDCAAYYTAGWWYNNCYESNLNGVYLGDNNPAATQKGITWEPWHGYYHSLKSAEMKIRPWRKLKL